SASCSARRGSAERFGLTPDSSKSARMGTAGGKDSFPFDTVTPPSAAAAGPGARGRRPVPRLLYSVQETQTLGGGAPAGPGGGRAPPPRAYRDTGRRAGQRTGRRSAGAGGLEPPGAPYHRGPRKATGGSPGTRDVERVPAGSNRP